MYISLCTDNTKIFLMLGMVATVTVAIAIYIIARQEEDYPQPLPAVDQGKNGKLILH